MTAPSDQSNDLIQSLQGGCLCGAIRYVASGAPFQQTICHCSLCRRAAGAPCVAWFSVSKTAFRIERGSLKYFQSTRTATRGFCERCGTQITFASRESVDEIDVTTCSLDQPDLVPPCDHTFTANKISWLHLADDVPQFAAARQ